MKIMHLKKNAVALVKSAFHIAENENTACSSKKRG